MSEKQIKYEYLPWDSDFFGYQTGKITINNFVEDCLATQIKNADAKLLYIFDNALSEEVDDFLILEGAAKYDCKVKYVKLLPRDCICPLEQNIEFYNGKLTDELEKLVYSSGKFSRFKKDKKLSGFFKPLYKRWILNSIEKEKSLLVVKEHNQIIGFLSFSISGAKANISLFSVDRDYLGRGFGTRLYRVLECFLVQSKIREIAVETQGENSGACFFYEKLGFELVKKQKIYHLWR